MICAGGMLSLAVTVAVTAVDAGVTADQAPRTPRAPPMPSGNSGQPVLLFPVVDGKHTDPRAALHPPRDEPALRQATDGSGDLLYDAPGFSARVATDGAVTFHDKHISLLNFLPFLPVAAPRNVPSVQSTFLSLLRDHRVPVADENRPVDTSFLVTPLLTRHRPDPREGCRTCDLPLDAMLVNITGRFDLTDEVMRMSSQDPYRYEKARFLVATRDLRVMKAATTYADNCRQSLNRLAANLREIACDARRSPRERRRIIEKLRDQLRDDSDRTLPESRQAVETITRFLQSRAEAVDGGDDFCPRAPAER